MLSPRLFFLLILTASPVVWTDASSQPSAPWKLTVGDYNYRDYSGVDVNLRWRGHDSDAWIGTYHDPQFGTQSRAGVDTAIALATHVQLQPSLQIATQGFVGGSLNVQVGEVWYAFAGLGRTNLKPYFNLNFDPNDAVTYGVGHQNERGAIYSVFVIADNRLGTDQEDWHFNVRLPIEASRATMDVMYKQGLSDVGRITAWGYSGTYDWPNWFIRFARDPYQNFSAQSAWRIAIGIRF
jgi:hypothetical protein